MATAIVPLDNDWEYEWYVSRKATTTGNVEAAEGLSGVTAHFALTEGGAAIAGTSTSLTERSAFDGRYFGILDMAALNTALSGHVNTELYEVLVVSGDAEKSRPVMIRATDEVS